MIAAARFPLRSDPAKSQFLRPRAQGRIWFSAQLLSMVGGIVRRASRGLGSGFIEAQMLKVQKGN